MLNFPDAPKALENVAGWLDGVAANPWPALPWVVGYVALTGAAWWYSIRVFDRSQQSAQGRGPGA